MKKNQLNLFDAYGVEIEYMLVDRASLAPAPVADLLLEKLCGSIVQETEVAGMACSNELVLHVFEMKIPQPTPSLIDTHQGFSDALASLKPGLDALGVRLMPGGAHPWMNPSRDARIWPHGDREIYEAFHRIFDCSSHGWTNLQSMHLNLPFSTDEEFGLLHAAIRFLLPVIPALTAASPYLEGQWTGMMDARLDAYAKNCAKIPSITGSIIPEPVFTRNEYDAGILDIMYREIEPHDPDRILRYEWLNARGAIARFDRNAIEIRVMDAQECPAADLAAAWAVTHTLKAMCSGVIGSQEAFRSWPTESLKELLLRVARDADEALVPGAYAEVLTGVADTMKASDLWGLLRAEAIPSHPVYDRALNIIINRGCLARRMVTMAGQNPSRQDLEQLADKLCDCLEHNRLLHL